MHYYEGDYCPKCNSSKKNKKIKVNTICFETTIQSVNDLVISAPIGIDIDSLTGKLNSKTHIEIISPPTLTARLDNHVLIIEGLLHVKIVFENPKTCPCTDELKSVCQEVFIPIQSVLTINECNKCNNNFHSEDDISIQTKAKVISTSIFGYPNRNTAVAGNQINLVVKAVLEITVYIFEEEIIDLSCYYTHFDR